MSEAVAPSEAQRLRSTLENALAAEREANHPVSESARSALFGVVDALESSGGAIVLPLDSTMSTQQAADALGISRMTVVRLIDRGELATEGGGVHRRIAAAELSRYRAASSSRRRDALRSVADEVDDHTPPDEVIETR